MPQQSRERPLVERLQHVIDSDPSRLFFSALIIISVLPFSWIDQFSWLFFIIFSFELGARIYLLRQSLKKRELSRFDVLFLIFDALATFSFLPLHTFFDVRFLRLFRLSRMLLLLSYWAPIGKEIWFILAKKERRYQILFVFSLVILLSFIAGIILYHFGPQAIDYNDDGKISKPDFWTIVWWSFRQLQDPGNLIKSPSTSIAFILSLLLTTLGVFIISFFIGIGTSIVQELVKGGRQKRLGLSGHTLIANIGPHSQILVEELVAYYKKSFRSPRLVTMGSAESRYDYMYDDQIRSIRYRQGNPNADHDLLKVDADRAKRVILLGNGENNLADSEVISQILSVRQVNPTCRIFAELVRADNYQAAKIAGGKETVAVMAHHLVSLLLADILLFPSVDGLYQLLLTSEDSEIYTCIYGIADMQDVRVPEISLSFGELLERAYERYGILLLGYTDLDEREERQFHLVPEPQSHLPSSLDGFIALSPGFKPLSDFCRHIDQVSRIKLRDPQKEESSPFDGLKLNPESSSLEEILICGYHEGLVDLCEQLILLCKAKSIFIVVPDHTSAAKLVKDLLQKAQLADEQETLVLYRLEGHGKVRYQLRGDPSQQGEIAIIADDWSEGHQFFVQQDSLENENSAWKRFSLASLDAILLTYTISDPDPDARTALTLLKLMHLKSTKNSPLKPTLRIVCELLNGEKKNLLRQQFHGDPAIDHLAIISAEELRHALLAQAIFVPGSEKIYRTLLNCGNPQLDVLEVEATGENTLHFSSLFKELHSSAGRLPLAIEVKEGNHRRLILNPDPKSKDAQIKTDELLRIFTFGKSGSFE